MKKFVSLPDEPQLGDVFTRFPEGVWPLLTFHDIKLRGESPLTVGQRELIAAYVSGLNACRYCYEAHRAVAESFDIDPDIFEKLLDNPSQAGIGDEFVPILAYVKKLTESPSHVTQKDAQDVYEAGWDERALYDAIVVCALFNFMNRIVEGCGVVGNEMMRKRVRAATEQSRDDPEPYRNFARGLGIDGPDSAQTNAAD
jgi:uncharacterized peroxidase-related enzyme